MLAAVVADWVEGQRRACVAARSPAADLLFFALGDGLGRYQDKLSWWSMRLVECRRENMSS